MIASTRYRIDVGISVVLLGVLVAHYTGALGANDTVPLMLAAVAGTAPVLWAAWMAIVEHEWASMDLLASIALIFSIASHEWPSAVFIALMLAAARMLGEITQDRTERSIRGLLKLRPATAKVEREGAVKVVPIDDIHVGDILVVDIGERIAVDGMVISGDAAVDESSLTGESQPIEKTKGDLAHSSTLVQSGSVRIEVQKIGKDTTFEKIIALVESSRAEKPDTQTLGERFGKLYLISVFIGSGLLYFATRNLPLVLAVVLVVCADDVAIAIPLAYMRAIGSAAFRGIIIKGGKHLEAFGQADVIVFDKTGTLTEGELSVVTVVPEGVTESEVIEAGALAARRSTHPRSRAITAYADTNGVAKLFPDEVDEHGGQGIIARLHGIRVVVGKREFLQEMHIDVGIDLEQRAMQEADRGYGITYVARGDRVIGFVAMSDTLKSNARDAIAELKRLGFKKTVMLSGDNERTARFVANKLGIDECHANLLPKDKVLRLQEIQRQGAVVMVGDGVNDAAALAVADVGVAMGALGSEGAIESAEIVLMRDDLSMLPEVLHLARAAHRVSVQDFWIWGSTNALGLFLVFGGVIGASGAAAYNFISDFFPLFNSMRVR